MKRILILLTLPLLLCGCGENLKSRPQYLVSAIGFDGEKGGFRVCVEAVVVNSEESEQEIRLISGNGESLEAAFDEILRQSTQGLMLSHCGVLVIGDGITDTKLTEICDYCYDKDEITLSAFFVSTENAERLLSCKSISSVSTGYDVMGLLEQYSESSRVKLKNRFFEIEALREKGEKPTLPRVTVREDGYYFEQ